MVGRRHLDRLPCSPDRLVQVVLVFGTRELQQHDEATAIQENGLFRAACRSGRDRLPAEVRGLGQLSIDAPSGRRSRFWARLLR